MVLSIAFTLFLLGGFYAQADPFPFPGYNGTKSFFVKVEFFNVEPKNSNVTKPPKPTTDLPLQSTTGAPLESTTSEPVEATTGSTAPTSGPLQSTTGQPETDKCKQNNGMTEEVRNVFLDEHNKLRSMTAKGLAENPLGTNGYAPKAARMLKMVYDCKIEETAMEHAAKCEFKHSDTKSLVGENIWAILPSDKNLTKLASWASNSWFNELKKYGVPPDNILTSELWDRPNMAIGHYTQVVWETSYKLGCGAVVCDTKMTLVVCQYGPPGNWIGNIIYTIGEPCQTDDDCKCDGCKCSRDEALCIKPQ